ncbi:prepilin-type N-terminal cleavage/methylation domain-containing protein [Lysobacter sp. K5869]|uniref:prepilin-type N-terminal cleavage/methylation domain-containing protein n=1 Tax=Lysobacter sp. K5869 TaxID=2820808 RepID=UPI001C05F391|nr:prepilin-type N-terminal cleavage/methylation domain-containing protein [Lysobacter sp. K5869]QWP79015.1 prepilin-type N-terminal cleavage/methylation domain-containing protein [Lysobacter sp. K5869]
MKRRAGFPAASGVRGLSLIELMVALALGLLLTAGALSIFLASRAAFRTTEDLSRVQEAGRIAFELMARDVREAGGNQCAGVIRFANVTDERATAFWSKWSESFRGFGGDTGFAAPAAGFGSATGERVSGSDAFELHSTQDLGLYLVEAMTRRDAALKVNAVPSDMKIGDTLMVCDFRLVSVFKVTSFAGAALGHGTDANCGSGFTRLSALLCDDGSAPAQTWHLYGRSSVVSRPQAVRWFVGRNRAGKNSLFRQVLYSDQVPTPAPDEVAEGVSQMAVSYLSEGQPGYRTAAAVTDWARVKAARVVLTIQSERSSGVDGDSIGRTVTSVLTLRNRNL